MPPQSETARRLFRLLGRRSSEPPTVVLVVGQEYGRYVDAYNTYLEAVDSGNTGFKGVEGAGR